ncbi:hypothetical protein FACS1894181_13700 [Bacteroidia bacterium]|nr:hypothetical protein FACS1894181_13700 [Bacteroidia bacterium]
MIFDSNFPMSLHIGGHVFLLHSLFDLIATFVAFRYYLVLRKRRGDTVNHFNRLVALAGATVGAVAGSHLLGACENIPQWIASSHPWLYLWLNKTMAGGLAGGLIGVELFKKVVGERQSTGDLFTYPLLLGIIIGRFGCFSTGIYEETYGIASSLPWAMDLGDGIYRHPVALYEIIFLAALWIVLKQIQGRYTLQPGALFKLFMVSYFLFRFLLDFIKPGWRYFLGLGSIQLACLLVLLYYIPYIIHLSVKMLKGINRSLFFN